MLSFVFFSHGYKPTTLASRIERRAYMDRQMSGQSSSTSQTETLVDGGTQDVPTVRLRLRKPRSDKKVQWTHGTVDNENMNKKKSKCCCIYEKPKKFGESSSEDSDDECEHCHGRKEAHKKPVPSNDEPSGDAISSHPEPIATGGSA